MSSDLCIGIVAKPDVLEIAALEPRRSVVVTQFPATVMGLAALIGFMAGYETTVRLAISGVAALSVAFAIGKTPHLEVFIVSAAVADQPTALAQYAERSI